MDTLYHLEQILSIYKDLVRSPPRTCSIMVSYNEKSTQGEFECPICLETRGADSCIVASCGHKCCDCCTYEIVSSKIDIFEKPSCPMCRKEYSLLETTNEENGLAFFLAAQCERYNIMSEKERMDCIVRTESVLSRLFGSNHKLFDSAIQEQINEDIRNVFENPERRLSEMYMP